MNRKAIIKEITKRNELIIDQNLLLKLWKKAPAHYQVKISIARAKIKGANIRIKELELILEPLNAMEVKNTQIDMFSNASFAKGSGMVNRAVNIDLKVSKGHNMLIPDKVHQKDVIVDVKAKKAKNKSQNQIVLDIFRNRPQIQFTAWQILDHLQWPVQRITSVRRAMSDLSKPKNGLLIKLDATRMEREGENNHLYQFRKI